MTLFDAKRLKYNAAEGQIILKEGIESACSNHVVDFFRTRTLWLKLVFKDSNKHENKSHRREMKVR